jgi:hypothetical protein
VRRIAPLIEDEEVEKWRQSQLPEEQQELPKEEMKLLAQEQERKLAGEGLTIGEFVALQSSAKNSPLYLAKITGLDGEFQFWNRYNPNTRWRPCWIDEDNEERMDLKPKDSWIPKDDYWQRYRLRFRGLELDAHGKLTESSLRAIEQGDPGGVDKLSTWA